MNQAALLRRLGRHQGSGYQVAPGGLYLPDGVLSPRAQLQLEIDHRRDNLAEKLLEILTENLEGDTDVADALATLAKAALAAAEIIHPDLQEEVPGA